MALTDDSALRNLSQLIMNTQALQQSPDKAAGMDDIVQRVLSTLPMFENQQNGLIETPTSLPQTSQSSSTASASPRDDSPENDSMVDPTSIATANILSGAAVNFSSQPRAYKVEPWYECFNTTSYSELKALIYSVYVIQRDDKNNNDGHDHYECINRLQSKCKYRIRIRRQNEFFVVEEKSAHNHAMEPVGSPGSHAGLPKTLREIVDNSFKLDWPQAMRQQKIEEEVKRLGLPHNPRLGRQVDNRIAYLRRVKNLNDMRKVADQDMPSINEIPSMGMTADVSINNNTEELMKMMLQIQQGVQNSPTEPPQVPMNASMTSTPTVLPPTQEMPSQEDIMKIMMQQLNEAQNMDPAMLLNILANQANLQMPECHEEQSSSCSTPEARMDSNM